MEYDQNQACEYLEECKNRYNSLKCNRCINYPFNFEKIDRIGEGGIHDKKSRSYFNFTDNYDPE